MSTSNISVSGKTALVTGAASGLGREIAITFARAGAQVAVADLNAQGAEAVAAELRAANLKAMAVAMDVTDEAAVDAGVDAAAAHFGSLDILVSNAGIQIVNPIDHHAAPRLLLFLGRVSSIQLGCKNPLRLCPCHRQSDLAVWTDGVFAQARTGTTEPVHHDKDLAAPRRHLDAKTRQRLVPVHRIPFGDD